MSPAAGAAATAVGCGKPACRRDADNGGGGNDDGDEIRINTLPEDAC
jgi:hypothetical protein